VAGIVVALFEPWVAIAIYVGVALVWLVPDRRISRVIEGYVKAPTDSARWAYSSGTNCTPSLSNVIVIPSLAR
jgi:hypothetical protein